MDKVFVDGLNYYQKEVNYNGSSFTARDLVVDSQKFVDFLSNYTQEDGKCRIKIKESPKKPGTFYMEPDTYKKQ